MRGLAYILQGDGSRMNMESMAVNMKSTMAKANEIEGEADIERFLNHCQRISITKLLCLLTKAIQQHRGASTAVLSGDSHFLPLVEKRQKSIQRILSMLEHVNNGATEVIAPAAIENIVNEWKTIVIGWRHDQIMDNFQFHSHLVESLHKLIRINMIKQLLPELVVEYDVVKPVIKSIFIKLPQLNEYLAMLRGLCVDISVRKSCEQNDKARIAYLVKLIRKESDSVLQALEKLKETIKTVPAVDIILGQKSHLNRLLVTIEVTILESAEIHADGSQLFDMATDIIDRYWFAIEQGIQQADHYIYKNCTE